MHRLLRMSVPRQRMSRAGTCLVLLLLGLPAQAVDYVFPGNLPPTCSGSGSAYACGVLTLVAGDTVTMASPKPTSITFTGAFTVGNGVLMNSAGLADDLHVVVNGVFTLGPNAVINGNVASIGAFTTGADSKVGGNLTASSTTGVVTLGANTVVGGNVQTDEGAVTIGDNSAIAGNVIISGAGVLTMTVGVRVLGNVSTVAGAITIGDSSSIGGNVAITGAGVLTMTTNITVHGNVSTIPGAITIGAGSLIVGNVLITGAGVVTLTSAKVCGSVNTVAGAITLTDTHVGLGVAASGAGVVTLTNSFTNDSGLILSASCAIPPASGNASAFACLEAGVAYSNINSVPSARNPLYTKLAGTPFALDVLALKTDGTVEANYVASGGIAKSVTLDLVDGSAAGCAGLPGLSGVASQAISFTGSELISGRTTGPALTVSNAYSNLRCRVTDANQTPAVVSCSSDNFAVRPSSATLLTTATAAAPSVLAAPSFKAGAPFALRATAGSSYTGTLTLDTGKLTAQIPVQSDTHVIGGVVGTLTPGALVSNAGAVSATYGEVGYVYLAPGAYRDDTFTAVDSAAGDCITDATNDNYLSDALVGTTGKYGCSIGNAAAVSLGRFSPDHFALTASAFAPACGLSSNSFTYMGQPFALSATLEAQNVAGAKTQNFSGVFAMASVVAQLANNGVALDSSRLTGQGSPVWASGTYPFVATGFARGAAPEGAYDNLSMGLQVHSDDAVFDASTAPYLSNRNMAASDCTSDKAGTSDGTCTASRMVQNAKLRYGRIKLKNAYGSERQAIQIPMAFEYWSSLGWQNNLLDSCSAASLASSNFALAFPLGAATKPNNLQACDTALSIQSSPPTYVLNLSAAGKSGWADIALNMGTTPPGTQCLAVAVTNPGVSAQPVAMGWLQNTDPTVNPRARATFGIFKSPLIYRRENY